MALATIKKKPMIKRNEQYDHLNKFHCLLCGNEFLSRGKAPKCPDCRGITCKAEY